MQEALIQLAFCTLLTCYSSLEWEMAVNWSPIACIRLYSMCRYSTRKHRVGQTLSRHNIYKRSQCLTPPRPLEVNSGLSVCMHIWEMYLKCKYSFCCVDNCKRYNWEAWWKCSLATSEDFVYRHIRKGRKRSKVLIPKLKRPLLCLCISLTFTEK